MMGVEREEGETGGSERQQKRQGEGEEKKGEGRTEKGEVRREKEEPRQSRGIEGADNTPGTTKTLSNFGATHSMNSG
jgi:hypothetical protein